MYWINVFNVVIRNALYLIIEWWISTFFDVNNWLYPSFLNVFVKVENNVYVVRVKTDFVVYSYHEYYVYLYLKYDFILSKQDDTCGTNYEFFYKWSSSSDIMSWYFAKLSLSCPKCVCNFHTVDAGRRGRSGCPRF